MGRELAITGLTGTDPHRDLRLTGEDLGDSGLGTLRAHSITYRIAVGPNAGRKALTLRTMPGREEEPSPGLLARADGFSPHAGVTVGARDSAKRERLCRYLARPPVAHDRLSLTRDGRVAYALKTPYRDGTTHVILEPKRKLPRQAHTLRLDSLPVVASRRAARR